MTSAGSVLAMVGSYPAAARCGGSGTPNRATFSSAPRGPSVTSRTGPAAQRRGDRRGDVEGRRQPGVAAEPADVEVGVVAGAVRPARQQLEPQARRDRLL